MLPDDRVWLTYKPKKSTPSKRDAATAFTYPTIAGPSNGNGGATASNSKEPKVEQNNEDGDDNSTLRNFGNLSKSTKVKDEPQSVNEEDENEEDEVDFNEDFTAGTPFFKYMNNIYKYGPNLVLPGLAHEIDNIQTHDVAVACKNAMASTVELLLQGQELADFRYREIMNDGLAKKVPMNIAHNLPPRLPQVQVQRRGQAVHRGVRQR